MGFIEGQSLSQRLAEGPLPPREAAALMVKVAEAIEYAHSRGVIHRDLKPGNILLDRSGHPRVTDFGLAKRLQSDSGLTGSGQIMGTPSYMPPEQAGGNRGEVGPAADVYALGATLYSQLTGRPPFQAATAMDTVLMVIGEEPVPPRRLNASIPRDLETICLKCLEKEPARRYAKAAALAEDLRHFLAGEPIAARPATRLERAFKWARRRPTIAALIGLVILSTGLGLGGSISGWRSALAALGQAELNLHINRIALAGREWQIGNAARANEILDQAPPDLRGWEWAYTKRLCQVDLLRLRSEAITDVALSPDGSRIALVRRRYDGPPGEYSFVVAIHDATSGRETLTLPHFPALVVGVRFTADGHGLLTLTGSVADDIARRTSRARDGSEPVKATGGGAYRPPPALQLWDVATGRETLSVRASRQRMSTAAGSDDVSRLAVVSWDVTTGLPGGASDGPATPPHPAVVDLWDAKSGTRSLTLRQHVGRVDSAFFVPDLARLVTVSSVTDATGRGRRSVTQLWDTTTGREIAVLDERVGFACFSPDGHTLLAMTGDGSLTLRDKGTGKELLDFPWPTMFSNGKLSSPSVAFSPDGRRVACATTDGTLKVWNTATGQAIRSLRGRAGNVAGVAVSADGGRFVVTDVEAGRSHLLTVHDIEGGESRPLRGHSGAIRRWAFSRAGGRLATAGDDGTVRVWGLDGGREPLVLPGPGEVGVLAFSRDGRRLVAASDSCPGPGEVRIWDVSPERGARSIADRGAKVLDTTYSPDGSRITAIREDGEVLLGDAATGQLLRRSKAPQVMADVLRSGLQIALSPDGDRVALSAPMKRVRLYATTDGRELVDLNGGGGSAVAFSPDGQRVAASDGRPLVVVYDAASGRRIFTCDPYAESSVFPDALGFCPDGTRLAGVIPDGTLAVWDAATGRKVLAASLPGHPTGRGRAGVAWSHDGSRIAVLLEAAGAPNAQGIVMVLDARSGAELRRIDCGMVTTVLLSSDGQRAFTGGGDGVSSEVKVWELDSGREVLNFREPGGHVTSLTLDPGGGRLAAGDVDGGLRCWDACPFPTLTSMVVDAPTATDPRGPTAALRAVFFFLDGHLNWYMTLLWCSIGCALVRAIMMARSARDRRRKSGPSAKVSEPNP
jgi:WD40 repeat protein